MIGLACHTDALSDLSTTTALDLFADVGIDALELACGGQSAAPHIDLPGLLASHGARRALLTAVQERGLRIAALNCSAWPLHPCRHELEARLIDDTLRLAGMLEVDTVVTMSGCPGCGGEMPNWIAYPWPDEAVHARGRQWDAAVEYWAGVADAARRHGIKQLALELHPGHLVHNVPTLQRMRAAVGPVITANVDTSHLFWQQADPAAVARALGDAVGHVHLKDIIIDESQLAVAGVLDERPFTAGIQRAWTFAVVGRASRPGVWRRLIATLDALAYDGVVSIENAPPDRSAHPELSQPEALREAATFARALLSDTADGMDTALPIAR